VIQGGNAGSHLDPPYFFEKTSGPFCKDILTNLKFSADVFSISCQDIVHMLTGYHSYAASISYFCQEKIVNRSGSLWKKNRTCAGKEADKLHGLPGAEDGSWLMKIYRLRGEARTQKSYRVNLQKEFLARGGLGIYRFT
jgi:hypothetical protein